MSQLFRLGDVVATPGALEALQEGGETAPPYLDRHANGDWGEVCAADGRLNSVAVKEGARILSAYTLHSGVRVWILTEADRSATTILLPDEY